jgi:hypothetical protein
MTSVLSRIAQIRPFTFYIVENNGGYILKTLTLGDTYDLDSNTILSDMGKTVVVDGYIYRKVQVVTVNDVISSGNQTGYICLNSDEAPLFDGSNQGISKLN